MSQFKSCVRFRSSLLSITDFSCRPLTCRQSNEEQTTVHQVVLPRAGVFVKHSGRLQAVADSNQVIFFNANEPYRVSHPVPGGDEFTVLVFSTDTLAQVSGFYRHHSTKLFSAGASYERNPQDRRSTQEIIGRRGMARTSAA
jgi:AraC family transcriptional regulator